MANNWEIVDSEDNLGDCIVGLKHLERYWVVEQVGSIRSRGFVNKGNVITLKRSIPIGNYLELARVFVDALEVDVVSSTILFVGMGVSVPSLDSVIETGTVVHDLGVEPDVVFVVIRSFRERLLAKAISTFDSELSRDRLRGNLYLKWQFDLDGGFCCGLGDED